MVAARSQCTTIKFEQVHESTGIYFFEEADLKQVIVVVVVVRKLHIWIRVRLRAWTRSAGTSILVPVQSHSR